MGRVRPGKQNSTSKLHIKYDVESIVSVDDIENCLCERDLRKRESAGSFSSVRPDPQASVNIVCNCKVLSLSSQNTQKWR